MAKKEIELIENVNEFKQKLSELIKINSELKEVKKQFSELKDAVVEFMNTQKIDSYKINEGDLCYQLFVEHGFEWGGNWTNSKDYQHFEIPDEQVRQWYP